jgi:uncharacterized phage protein gp47/JayE
VVADHGIKRKPATYAVRKVETSGSVELGTRWGLGDTTYQIKAKLSDNTYSADCEQAGIIGNTYSGALENIDNVRGILATATDIIPTGEDEDNDDNLRERFNKQVRSASTSGNAYDYRNWAMDVPGCGDAKVFPLWNGAGTVKILVVDENMEVDVALPVKVHDYIEAVRPIGALVTVTSPTNLAINVSAKITLDGSKLLAEVKSAFMASVKKYLQDTVFEVYSLSYAKIGSILLSTPGVKDYTLLLMNNDTKNITIGVAEMPICGTITLSEVV